MDENLLKITNISLTAKNYP